MASSRDHVPRAARVRALPPRFAAAVALALSLSACTNPTDALYDAPLPPRAPVQPDAAQAGRCAACAQADCAGARDACLQDAACFGLLQCKGTCSDPDCLDRCTAKHGYAATYDDLWACVMIDRCTDDCSAGRNLSCVGRYDAPRAAPDRDRFEVAFRYKNPRTGLAYAYPGDERDEQFAAGASARSCLPQDSASSACQEIDETTVDGAGRFALDLLAHEVTRDFRGVIEVELPDGSAAPPDRFRQLGWRDRYYPPQLARARELRFYVFWRGWFREAAGKTAAQTLDFATAAPLALYMEDCSGAPASGVRFEVEGVAPADVLHQRLDGSLARETDTGSAMVLDVPEAIARRALAIRAVDVESGRVLAERLDVYVRPGFTTHVWLNPLTR